MPCPPVETTGIVKKLKLYTVEKQTNQNNTRHRSLDMKEKKIKPHPKLIRSSRATVCGTSNIDRFYLLLFSLAPLLIILCLPSPSFFRQPRLSYFVDSGGGLAVVPPRVRCDRHYLVENTTTKKTNKREKIKNTNEQSTTKNRLAPYQHKQDFFHTKSKKGNKGEKNTHPATSHSKQPQQFATRIAWKTSST